MTPTNATRIASVVGVIALSKRMFTGLNAP
jgi:hypothetical protein